MTDTNIKNAIEKAFREGYAEGYKNGGDDAVGYEWGSGSKGSVARKKDTDAAWADSEIKAEFEI